MAMAVLHVLGALGATFLYGILAMAVDAWERERVTKRRLQDASIALGVPLTSLENDESLAQRLIHYSAERYSGELLRNRLSDLCGSLRTLWGWLGGIAQLSILGGVGWTMYTEGAKNAAFMWFVLVVAILFSLASVAFSYACLLLTGRYPGEAKLGRKAVAAAIGH